MVYPLVLSILGSLKGNSNMLRYSSSNNGQLFFVFQSSVYIYVDGAAVRSSLSIAVAICSGVMTKSVPLF